MTEAMVRGLQQTIKECDECLSSGDVSEAKRLQRFIIDTYGTIVPKLNGGLSNYSGGSMFNDHFVVDWIGDIKVLKKKLEFLLDTEGGFAVETVNKKSDDKGVTIHNHNAITGSGNSTNTNTNTNNNTVNNTIDIKAELSKVREKIEADEILDDDAKEEIHAKLNEIESVMDENPTNNEKWKKLKGVVNWVTTKGYRVGEMVIPLLTKAMFPEVEVPEIE